MKLELRASKLFLGSKYRPTGMRIVFTVVDLDQFESYPRNFVCNLPREINIRLKNQNKFVKIFSKESLNIAKELLLDLLNSGQDLEVEREIKQRLRILDSRTILTFKCHSCGELFDPNEPEFIYQNICLKCK